MKKILFVLILLFLGIVGLEIMYFSQVKSYPYQLDELVNNQTELAENTPPITVPQYFVSNISELDEIKNRPLFIKDRKPPSAEEIKKIEIRKKKNKFPKIVLTAIIIIDNTQRALFKDLKTKKSFSLNINSNYENWTLKQIFKDKVIFELATEKQELLLRDYKNPLKKILRKPILTQKPKTPDLRSIFKQNNPTRSVPSVLKRQFGTPRTQPKSSIGGGFGPAF